VSGGLPVEEDCARFIWQLHPSNDGTFGEKLNIKWMEHSNGIILGVCGTCFSQFDSRNPEDLKWLLKDSPAQRQMGKARASEEEVALYKNRPLEQTVSNSVPVISNPVPVSRTAWQNLVAWIKKIFL